MKYKLRKNSKFEKILSLCVLSIANKYLFDGNLIIKLSGPSQPPSPGSGSVSDASSQVVARSDGGGGGGGK